ncbi:MAG: helix-turn-helix transcriptional regulator [Deltaproteobacteria bacterium]|nr:helix-turn-helix transcriptional regulator [Deltaproteobacteria bacterium]
MPRKEKPLGDRIRRLRREKEISLSYLASETGRSEDYLKKVEANEVFPPVAMLLQLARALHVDTGTFLKLDGTPEKLAKEREKRTDNYIYKTLTPASADRHLKAFDITIPQGAPVREGLGYRHQGEEFAYVLEGQVEYTVGENVSRLGPGESVHFNSNIPHNLTNVGDEEAHLLVILYTP